MALVRSDRTWEIAEPIAVSDTVDNIGGTSGKRALAIHNRSAATSRAHISFEKGSSSSPASYVAVVAIPAAGDINGNGRWTRVMATGTTGGGTSGLAHETIHTTAVGLAFTNQPANDGVEIVSSNAGDTTQSATVYGTTTGTDTVVAETVALNGTTAVSTTKVDWGVILGVELSASCAGTVTFREASGNATITTITTGNLTKGIETTAAGATTNINAYNVAPVVAASGATTKQIGLEGTNAAGTTIRDSQALAGATITAMNSAFATVTKVFTGDVENTVTVTVSNSADFVAFY